ncbi:MAG: HAD family phosphatase [Clostridiales bacterium]|nr:HAD family phosphatase [Candidatus Blautia equi]
MIGAIFDIDGTLLDSMSIWEEAGIRFLNSLGITPRPDYRDVVFEMSMEESTEYTRKEYNLSLSTEEVKEGILRVIHDFYYYEVDLKPGVPAFLSYLKDRQIPMIIASSGHRDYIEASLKRLGIRQYFSGIITCTEAGAGKHQPLVYQMAAENIGCPIKNCLVFEDVFHAIHTAKEAGFITVGIYDSISESYEGSIREESDLYLHDFSQLFVFADFLKTL